MTNLTFHEIQCCFLSPMFSPFLAKENTESDLHHWFSSSTATTTTISDTSSTEALNTTLHFIMTTWIDSGPSEFVPTFRRKLLTEMFMVSNILLFIIKLTSELPKNFFSTPLQYSLSRKIIFLIAEYSTRRSRERFSVHSRTRPTGKLSTEP